MAERPDDGRRPGGKGRRTGELRRQREKERAQAKPSQASKRRIEILREPLWEVQPSETAKAYEAFRVYRDLGPSRTQARAAELLGYKVSETYPSAASNHLAEWSSRFRWVERVRAYDAWLGTVLTGQIEKEQRAAARSWFARQEEIRQAEWDLMQQFVEKLRRMLQHPVTRIRKERVFIDKPQWVYLTTIEPARWDFKAAADIMQRVFFQGRLAAEMVTDGARLPTPDGTERAMSDVDAWLASLGVDAAPVADDEA